MYLVEVKEVWVNFVMFVHRMGSLMLTKENTTGYLESNITGRNTNTIIKNAVLKKVCVYLFHGG